ncbi:MAG: 23S rRNA (guanosine(2251)-2'-O)-methyltransferase RlmB [Candidatus Faecisoma sp.]|nr:23S rRNA (guanosine(2251)-2'-O)-methyltransferase RlmB [Acholeplasma sp.]MDY2892280.1 23S rRNA (guanosine(2251)-2'-O)-methyltransferase RlmB [Candidatus Faecisoma sp.]
MYVYGRNVIKDYKNLKKVYVQDSLKNSELVKNINVPIKYLNKRELDKMVSGNHQGIVGEVEDYKYFELNDLDNDVIVILDHLEDPHNLGAIIRTCEAAGFDNIIIPKNRSVSINGTVVKTSVGTIERVKIAQVTNLNNAIQTLKKKGYWIIGTDMIGTDYKELDYNGKVAIVIGNEGAGISRLVKENCDFIATIPMNGQVNSLNASVAAGVLLFEILRQRR